MKGIKVGKPILNLEYYKILKYKKVVTKEKGEGEWEEYFLARILELEDCFAVGRSRQEALFELDQAFDSFIEDSLENDKVIPEPERTKISRGSGDKLHKVIFFIKSPDYINKAIASPLDIITKSAPVANEMDTASSVSEIIDYDWELEPA